MPHDAAAGASTKDRIETPPSGNKPAIAAVEAHHAEGMHEVMATETAAHEAHGCGCSCGHDDPAQHAPSLSAAPERDGGRPDGELDVRTLPHGQRHEIIFRRLQALAAGEVLVIVNDHDPKPLRYQAEALWPGSFTWTYREAGPQVWRLVITRAG